MNDDPAALVAHPNVGKQAGRVEFLDGLVDLRLVGPGEIGPNRIGVDAPIPFDDDIRPRCRISLNDRA